MQTSRHLFLLGFMGCGKSYWGKILASKLGLPFLDLDEWISDKEGKTVAQIFAEKGEAAFRLMERDALHSLADLPTSVVATGGGTPCFFDNMDWMNRNGTTIYLDTPPTLLAERLRGTKADRPLLAAMAEADKQEFISLKLQERMPFYVQAKLIIEQTGDEKVFEEALENAMRSI